MYRIDSFKIDINFVIDKFISVVKVQVRASKDLKDINNQMKRWSSSIKTVSTSSIVNSFEKGINPNCQSVAMELTDCDKNNKQTIWKNWQSTYINCCRATQLSTRYVKSAVLSVRQTVLQRSLAIYESSQLLSIGRIQIWRV